MSNEQQPRLATFQDLMVMSGLWAAVGASIIILQIVVVTKSTIPADTVYMQQSLLREELKKGQENMKVELDEITAFIDMHRTKMEALKTQAEQ